MSPLSTSFWVVSPVGTSIWIASPMTTAVWVESPERTTVFPLGTKRSHGTGYQYSVILFRLWSMESIYCFIYVEEHRSNIILFGEEYGAGLQCRFIQVVEQGTSIMLFCSGYGAGYQYNHTAIGPVTQTYLPDELQGTNFFQQTS